MADSAWLDLERMRNVLAKIAFKSNQLYIELNQLNP